MTPSHPLRLVLTATAFCLASLANAQTPPPDGPPPSGEHRGPPPAALDACAGKKMDDPCSFNSSKRGVVEGTCKAPEGKPLACRPARPAPPPAQ